VTGFWLYHIGHPKQERQTTKLQLHSKKSQQDSRIRYCLSTIWPQPKGAVSNGTANAKQAKPLSPTPKYRQSRKSGELSQNPIISISAVNPFNIKDSTEVPFVSLLLLHSHQYPQPPKLGIGQVAYPSFQILTIFKSWMPHPFHGLKHRSFDFAQDGMGRRPQTSTRLFF
jgi:hypothetical protein